MNTPTRLTVLILGANGRLGLAAAQAFDAAGWQVLAHVRRDPAPEMPPRARLVRAPLEALAVECAGAAVVVYGLNPLYTRWDAEAMPLARAGMDIAHRLGARFMLPGNVYNFGTRMPVLLREDTPQHPDTPKGQLRVAMEAELRRRCDAGALRVTVIRAGDFFGGGTGSWLDLVIAKSIARGKLVYPGPLDCVHAWAYLPDLARAFVAAAENDSLPAFENLHFAGHALTGTQLLAAIERAAAGLGIAPRDGWRHGTLPWGVLRLGGWVVPMWRELARMSYLWRVPHALEERTPRLPAWPVPTDIDAALAAAISALTPTKSVATQRAAMV